MNIKIIAIIATALVLTGCGVKPVKPEKEVFKQVEYVVRVPPKELTTLPAKPENIDVDKADQATVAEWMLKKEEYTRNVENLLTGVAVFLQDEQNKLNAKASEENDAAKKAAEEYDATADDRANKKKVDIHATPSR